MTAVITSEEYAEQLARRSYLLNKQRQSAAGRLWGWEYLRREIEAAMIRADLAADLDGDGDECLGYEDMSRIAIEVFTRFSPVSSIRLPEDP